MKTTKIGVHHSGPTSPSNPYSSSKNLTESQINKAHQSRDFNRSNLGYYIGYNVIIYPDGTWKQYRLLGEQTAASTGSNFNTFHICLLGNFTVGVDSPTKEQVASLKSIIAALIENYPSSIGIKTVAGQQYHFSAYNIFPHRALQPNHTSCYGSVLGDNWARDIAFQYLKQKNSANPFMFKMLSMIADHLNGIRAVWVVGGSDDSDEGINYL